MKQKKQTLYFEAKLNSFKKLNDRFLKAKCYVLALGKNQNKSYLSEENVNEAYPTLFGVPLVGHLMKDENGNYYLGGHDYKLDVNDGFKLKSQCVPFGFALPSDEPEYEDIVDEFGVVRKYLVCEVVIWIGRYPELGDAMCDDEKLCHQSMEILYEESEPLKEDNTYTNITKFAFDALCMLNKSDDPKFNVEPCFPESSIRAFNLENDSTEFYTQLEDMKNELKLCFAENNGKQGGTDLMDEKNKILEKYEKTIEDLDFSIEDLSVDELSQKMDELFGTKKKSKKKDETVTFSATYRQKLDKLCEAVRTLSTVDFDADGNFVREVYFYLSDFDDEYVYVSRSVWETNGDYSDKVGRIPYLSEDDEVKLGEFEEMVCELLTLDEKAELDKQRGDFEALQEEFSNYKKSYSNSNEDYETLVIYKQEKETDERIQAETNILNRFEVSIGETNEFKELKKTADKFSLKDLKKECIYIRGLYAEEPKADSETNVGDGVLNFSVEKPAITEETGNLPYGGIVEKYSKKTK